MSNQDLFSQKNIKPIDPERKSDILDELNLPSKLKTFLRENARNLQIIAISTAVIVVGWILYGQYTDLQENKGASLLSAALQESSAEQKTQTLANVIEQYPSTSAARWSSVEIAHLDYQASRFQEAATRYETILKKLPGDSSLAPLVRLNLAQSYEELADYDKALGQYQLLKEVTGFSKEAYLALGRVYVLQNEPDSARRVYEEYLDSLGDESDPAIEDQIQAKLALLQIVQPAVVPQPQPAEKTKE